MSMKGNGAMDTGEAGQDEALQSHLLAGVSRTFALTIPQLPQPLRNEVGNAYLLCRILDTIEDEPNIPPVEKTAMFEQFRAAVHEGSTGTEIAKTLHTRLSEATPPAENELILKIPEVLGIFNGFDASKRKAIIRCLDIMSSGMDKYQNNRSYREHGLGTLADMDSYCYHVAGVVGEMVTELFCLHSPEIAVHRHRMMGLATGFGQGLQMTNILKDIHADKLRGACWLPADVFSEMGLSLEGGINDANRDAYAHGMQALIQLAYRNLEKALNYTLCVPPEERGIRNFCLWAIGMAVLTLRKLAADPAASLDSEVKINRKSVAATITFTRYFGGNDKILRAAFARLGRAIWPDPYAKPLMTPAGRNGSSDPDLPPEGSTHPEEKLGSAVESALKALRGEQAASGFWSFDFEADCTIPAEYILWMHFTGEIDTDLQERMARYLRRLQQDGGGWPLYLGGKPDISCSVKAYYALKLAGDDPEAEHMLRACRLITHLGGATRANVFTRITLALFRQVPWRAVPFMPVEIMFLPKWFPFHLTKVSYWSRTVMTPLLVLYSHRAEAKNPTSTGIDELFLTPPDKEKHYFPVRSNLNKVFLRLERTARLFEGLIPGAVRKRATGKALDWMSERLNGTHGLGAIFPAMVNAHEALITIGAPPDDPRRQQASKALQNLVIHQHDEAYCQPCVSPVWDTALAALALNETGDEADRAAALRGLDWLQKRQLLDFKGDWCEQRPDLPGGGWPFQFENAYYPDLDDTAVVAFAMHVIDPERYRDSVDRAVQWLQGMQSRNGGFASFEIDNTQFYLNEIPFADHGALLDPPTADVSARCAMLFGGVRESHRIDETVMKRVIDYLRTEQEEDGSWFGRWGTNHIYGTWSVLLAQEQCGCLPQESVDKAVNWLKETQREDGGWGETNDSYESSELRGKAQRSTAFQTAWAVTALMAVGETQSAAVTRGIDYLLRHQGEDGLWHDPEFTCPGFPRVFYLKYHGYDKYFPIWALARYRRELLNRIPADKQAQVS